MSIWDRVKQSTSDLGHTIKNAWGNAAAAPVSFADMPDNERALLEPLHHDFLGKAQRGYFDEDVTRDYRRFLFRCGFEKADIDQSTAFMQNLAKAALPANRRVTEQVQDRYWRETGLTDTRTAAALLPDLLPDRE